MLDVALSLLVLGSFVLVGGAYVLWKRGGSRKQVVLMLVLAAVMVGNLLIWTIPDDSGETPAEKAALLEE